MTALSSLSGRVLPCRCDGDDPSCPLCALDDEREPAPDPHRELNRSELDDAVLCAWCETPVGVIEGADEETGWPLFGWVPCFASDDGPICEDCCP